MHNPCDGLIADQNGDHREHDRAREAGQVTELASPKSKPRVLRVTAVRDEGNGPESQAAGDLRRHHEAAEPDHRPGLSLATLMIGC